MEVKYNIIYIVLFSYLIFVYAREQLEYDPWINTAKPLGKAYSFSTCNYKLEAGYTCLSCIRALHCYASNFAILVDCPLLFPYCRNGRCSRYEGAKCFEEKLSTSTNANIIADELHDNVTVISATEHKVTTDGIEHNVQKLEETPETLSADV
ncbi:uncharacterized protein LOC115455827 [Manduca sexta]|uniref:uncharacterized protein LOC115455827 n=1 Tax=Manduca sexta TaxID=7130 RepID=UPI00188E9012|nr:uncharacterized protein LOC115455827 [Manduca sexta]